MLFLHSHYPTPVLLNLGIIKIYWYGLLIAVGIVLGFFVFYKLARRTGINKNHIFDLFFWLIIWGVVGGRLYHVFSKINYYWQQPLEIFYIWQGGFGIYGIIIAGVVVILYFSKKLRNNYQLLITNYQLLILDLLAPCLALAQTIGRWGNYFNQELYGLPSNLPWSIPIDLINRLPGYENFTHFHPAFLYESLFCLILFIFLYAIVSSRIRRNEAMPRSYKHGFIFLSYLFLYPTWRFIIEFIRIDPQPVLLNLRLGQWVSLALIILSVIFYFLLKKWHNKKEGISN